MQKTSEKSTALLMTNCPCQSNKAYGNCCRPFHEHEDFPQTAEQLMRSRYAAYVLKNVPYIVETTVPNQQKLLNIDAIRAWAENTQWLGLQILNRATLTKTQSAVEFNAVFQSESGEQAHHEYSVFVKINERWYFVDPTVALPTMKQPCVCGSGKKFKYCCGGLL